MLALNCSLPNGRRSNQRSPRKGGGADDKDYYPRDHLDGYNPLDPHENSRLSFSRANSG